jgi:hypothetical protein
LLLQTRAVIRDLHPFQPPNTRAVAKRKEKQNEIADSESGNQPPAFLIKDLQSIEIWTQALETAATSRRSWESV